MKKYIYTKAFTLIELMVVIALVGIVAIVGRNFTFVNLSNDSKSTIFVNELINQYETVRNNALLGKSIGSTLEVPNTWTLEYNSAGSGSTQVQYFNPSPPTIYEEVDVYVDEFYFIKDINCLRVDRSISASNILFARLLIDNGNPSSILGCPTDSKILQFTAGYRNFESIIEINTLNGLLETKKAP